MIPSKKHIVRNADVPASMSPSLSQIESRRVAEALSEDRVRLFYQPIVRSACHSFVAFYEGLARIIMPDGAVIAAGRFIPFVENTPLGAALDRKTVELALITLANHPEIRLSVNMTVQSMSDPEWLSILEETDGDICSRLILEITESAAMSDVEMTTAFMHRVRKKGCSFALDDFGTGSTSFRYFKDFRFDIIKIDGLFIRDLPQDEANRVLVKALVDISQHFDMFTVAEFIETEAEADVASELGVDCLQGYLIGKPAEELLEPYFNHLQERKFAG